MKRVLWRSILIFVFIFIGGIVTASGGFYVVTTKGGGLWSQNGSNIYYNDGNVGIGTDDPAYKFMVKQYFHGSWIAAIHNTGYAANDYGLVVRADGGDPLWIQGYNGGNLLVVEQDGGVGIGYTDTIYKLAVNGSTYCTSGEWAASDERWKKDIKTIENPLKKVLRLRGVTYRWNREDYKQMCLPEGRQLGMIAQDMEKEFPECVSTDKNGYKSIDYGKFSAVLLESIKSQQKIIEAQNRRLQLLEEKLAGL